MGLVGLRAGGRGDPAGLRGTGLGMYNCRWRHVYYPAVTVTQVHEAVRRSGLACDR